MNRALHPRTTRALGATALLSFATDQLSKWWLGGLFDAPPSPIEVTSYFRLVRVWNPGISFGMLHHWDHRAMPLLLSLLALAVSALLVRAAYRSGHAGEAAAYGLIIGGALGNALDRLRFGAVADFFYFHLGALGWPAFNLADSAIFLGVSFLLLRQLRASTVRA